MTRQAVHEIPTRSRAAATPVLLVGALAVAMAQTIVVAALPVFQRELQTSATGVAWLLTAFMLASAVATPIAGRLGDILGYRPVLIACLTAFVAGTVLAAVANEAGSLAGVLTGRALQGISGGVFPLAFGIARTTVAPSRVRGVIAALSAMFGVGGALGMVVAGPITDSLGTTGLFWLILVLAALTLAGTALLPGRTTAPTRTGSVDLAGAVLLAGPLVCLLLAISQGKSWGWGSAPVLGLFAAAIVLVGGFVWAELRVADPLVDIRLMRHRALLTINGATLVISVAMFAAVTLIPQFVQTPPSAGYGFGVSATQTGLVMIPVAALMLIAGPLAGRIAVRARVPLQAGAVLAGVSFIVLAAAHGHLWEFYVGGAILGAGYGLAFASLGNLVVDAVPPERTGAATGINTILRTIGGAVGAQVSAVLLAGSVPAGTSLPTETGYVQAFVVFAVIAGCALAAATVIPSRMAE